MSFRHLGILMLLSISAAAPAEESAVYESFSGVKIGRVFLAPRDRDRLDERRLNPPAEGTAAGTGAEGAAPKARVPAAAGYIISSSGRARVWRNGDFIESTRQTPQRMAFPGDVKVTRIVPDEADQASDKEDQSEHGGEADGNAD